jgi:hypothetical protein
MKNLKIKNKLLRVKMFLVIQFSHCFYKVAIFICFFFLTFHSYICRASVHKYFKINIILSFDVFSKSKK